MKRDPQTPRHCLRPSSREVVLAAALVALITPAAPAAGGRLDLGLNVRSRYESLENFSIRNYAAGEDDVLLLRTRLGADYRWNPTARGFVELQDARYWLNRLSRSDFGQSSSYFDELDLRQAYAEWRNLGETPFGLKLGRQILVYGDRRVFAPAEWGNVGNYWWDAAKVTCTGEPATVDVFYARRVLSEPQRRNFDHHPHHVGAVYLRILRLPVTLDAFQVLKVDRSGAVRGERGSGDEWRHTGGVFSERRPGDGWDYGCFAAGQTGRAGGDEIRAYGFIGRAGRTFAAPGKPRLGVEVSLASGDGDPTDGTNGTFDGIFGAMDVPYGWMNVVGWKNLEDLALVGSVAPAKSLTVSVEYHGFRLARGRDAWYWASGKPERRDASGAAGRDLGHELDVIVRWPVRKELELLVGAARFFAGDFLRHTPGGQRDAKWAFAQLTCSL